LTCWGSLTQRYKRGWKFDTNERLKDKQGAETLTIASKRNIGNLCDTIVLPAGLRHIFVDFTTIPEALKVYFTHP
jgi:hypothetical protein